MKLLLRTSSAIIAAGLVLGFAACGSGGSGSAPSGATPTPTVGSGGSGTSNAGGALVTPTAVSVSGSQTVSGIDILVPATASTLNAELMGVNSSSAQTLFASNTGGSVARGSSALILIFGKGLSANAQVSISGPSDIAISNLQSVTSKQDNKPGVLFQVNVAGGAATGARTITIKDAQSNVTTFTGGLEVQ